MEDPTSLSAAPVSRLAIASLALSILWVCLSCYGVATLHSQTYGRGLAWNLTWIYLGWIPAVVFGHVAVAKIKRSNGAFAGKPIAVIGLVLGYLGVLLPAFLVTLYFLVWAHIIRGFG
ncbi:MAG: DUF4190 domain-containing protein [Terriglobales bacterium]